MGWITDLRTLEEATKKKPYDVKGFFDRMAQRSPEEQRKAFSGFGNPPDPRTSPDASYRKSYGAQQRGPTPSQGGGHTRQPLGHSRSGRGVIRKGVVGSPPKGILPPPGEKFKDDKKKKQAQDFFMGRQSTMQFESRLLDALYSDHAFLMEAVKRQKPVRKEMSGMKKALIGGAMAAALAAGVAGTRGKKKAGPERIQKTHQGTGVSAEDDDIGGSETKNSDAELMQKSKEMRDSFNKETKSLGKGRVTQDKNL